MDAELKAKWVKALRSGAYPQTKTYLQSDRGYCCLGVLCVVQGKEPKEIIPKQMDRMTAELPVGLSGGLEDLECSMLAEMNDGGKTFSEIADYIEAKL